jgi:eukaryotic-like serine/threonine-protein kinase
MPRAASSNVVAEQPPLFSPGDLIQARFRVVRLIGKGGMGEVYKAESVLDGQTVALKIVLPELLGSTRTRTRFEREVSWTRGIRHPNVVSVLEYLRLPPPPDRASTESIPCVVMEFLEGESLADYLERDGPMECDEAKPILCQIAAALAACHRAKIVHRDLKPDNVFLTSARSGGRVVLTDFGVARRSDGRDQGLSDPDVSGDALTASNVLVGTPDFMAPELLDLEDAIPASDIYSLGLVAYELVTGTRPFADEKPLQALFKRVRQPAPSPREMHPDIDPTIERVIMTCLERNPADRYADAEDLIRDLDGPNSPYLLPPRRRIRLDHLVLGIIGLLMLAAVIALVVGFAGK